MNAVEAERRWKRVRNIAHTYAERNGTILHSFEWEKIRECLQQPPADDFPHCAVHALVRLVFIIRR